MKQIIKSDFAVSKSQIMIRSGSTIILDALDTDIEEKYGQDHQELLKIYKIGNKYFIEGVEPLDVNQDIDEKYQEYGEPTLPPSQMRERMYHVIKHLKYSAEANSYVA